MTVAKSLDGDEFSENYCPYCGQKLIWPEQQEEPKEEAFDVVEYEWSQDNGCTTVCPHSTSIDELKPRIGSAHCKQYCPHFKGHYEEGKYIRCSYNW
jgi:DNA-directed RNA polymerase subunit RPC12/RpoP